MRLRGLIIFLVVANTSIGQSRPPAPTGNCSEIITRFSNGWKADSLGSDDYRFSVFETVRYARVDTVTRNMLFENFGKPNQTQRFFNGNTRKYYVAYIYYIENFRGYPKKSKYYEGAYLSFVFDNEEQFLVEIRDGDFCG